MRILGLASLKAALVGSAFPLGPAGAATFTWDGGGADDLFGTAEITTNYGGLPLLRRRHA